jgi:predicted metal-dependent hydrolase
MQQLELGGIIAPYDVIRSRRKTLAATINRDGLLIIRAPYNTRKACIAEFIKCVLPWIQKKLLSYLNSCPEHLFIDGERLPFRGGNLRLETLESPGIAQSRVVLEGKDIKVVVKPSASRNECIRQIKQSLQDWYHDQAGIIIPERFKQISQDMGLRPSGLKLKQQVSRWGSCSTKGLIAVNWQLIAAPPAVLDYVIVHELCHLTVKDHKAGFWESVLGHMPDYKVHRKWLKDNARQITFLTENSTRPAEI